MIGATSESTQEGTASPDLVLAVLEQVANTICSPEDSSEVSQRGATFSFSCMPAAGHATYVSIEQFSGQADAQSAFASAIGDHPAQDFHGYQTSLWSSLNPDPPQATERFRYWRAKHWVFTIYPFDDTMYSIAPGVDDVSDALYQAANQLGLLKD